MGSINAQSVSESSYNSNNSTIQETYQKSTQNARRLIKAHLEVLNVPGMSVAVSKNGRIIWSEAFGYADLEQKVPVTPLTKFRIASVSKSLTAAAITKLSQEGRLDLDAPIHDYLPSFPKKKYSITTRELAGHLAGIRHYKKGERINKTEHYNSVTEALNIFKDDTLLFKPGSDYEYSTYGYVLLSAIIENVSGTDYLTYMQEQIFTPLEMNHTLADFNDSLILNRSEFYVQGQNEERINAPYIDNSYKWAGGGYLSTAPDLVRFGNAHLNSSFFNQESLSDLFTTQITTSGDTTNYSIGWKILTDKTGRVVYYHGGNLTSGRAHLAIYPESELVIAILANTGENIGFNEEETFALANLFLNPREKDPNSIDFDPTGTYSFDYSLFDETNTGILQIFESGNHYEGEITLFSKPNPVPVINFKSPRETYLIAVPGSWMYMTIFFNETGFEGSWDIAGNVQGDFKNVIKIK